MNQDENCMHFFAVIIAVIIADTIEDEDEVLWALAEQVSYWLEGL